MYQVEPDELVAREDDKHLVLGVMAEVWGEQINGGTALTRWPRALAVAERGW
jgi:N-acetyl-beta-hexosaminidase